MDHMTQEANDSTVQVEIFGQTCTLCGGDPGYIRKLAQSGTFNDGQRISIHLRGRGSP